MGRPNGSPICLKIWWSASTDWLEAKLFRASGYLVCRKLWSVHKLGAILCWYWILHLMVLNILPGRLWVCSVKPWDISIRSWSRSGQLQLTRLSSLLNLFSCTSHVYIQNFLVDSPDFLKFVIFNRFLTQNYKFSIQIFWKIRQWWRQFSYSNYHKIISHAKTIWVRCHLAMSRVFSQKRKKIGVIYLFT